MKKAIEDMQLRDYLFRFYITNDDYLHISAKFNSEKEKQVLPLI